MSVSQLTLGAFVAYFVWVCVGSKSRQGPQGPLPPGPKGLPIIGVPRRFHTSLSFLILNHLF